MKTSLFMVAILLTSSTISMAEMPKPKRTPAQYAIGFGTYKVDNYSFVVSLDPDNSSDRLVVLNDKGEQICFYKSKRNINEKFLRIDTVNNPVGFSKAPHRFFVTEWTIPSSVAKFEYKIFDVSKPGGECQMIESTSANGFVGLAVEYEFDKDTLDVREIISKDTDGSKLLDRKTHCKISDKSEIECQTDKATAYP